MLHFTAQFSSPSATWPSVWVDLWLPSFEMACESARKLLQCPSNTMFTDVVVYAPLDANKEPPADTPYRRFELCETRRTKEAI